MKPSPNRLRFALQAAVVVWWCALPLPAQTPSTEGTPAATYLDAYREVLGLTPTGRVAAVTHLVLTRDVGTLTLEHGSVYLLSPVGGRTVGAVFRGAAHFKFTPPVPAEQAELQRFAGSPALDDSVTEVVLLFADSTSDQLRTLTYDSTADVGDPGGRVHDVVSSLKGDNEGDYRSDVIGSLLNGDRTGFFLAYLQRPRGGPVLFEIDPSVNEAVRLYRPVSHLRWGGNWTIVTQFTAGNSTAAATGWIYRERLDIPRYRLDVSLTSVEGSNLDFAASATLAMSAREAIGPWLQFGLHPKIVVDSARWSDGQAAAAFKAKDAWDWWVRAPRRLQPGDSVSLTLFYHSERGGVIDRYGNFFYIDPASPWFPHNQQGADFANFDITYHSPSYYPLASVGERVDSSVTGKVLTTHWVTRAPTEFAIFNLGLFETYHVERPDEPTLDVLLSEEAHRELRRMFSRGVYIPEQSHMRENVAVDVSNSLKFFTHLYGENPYHHFFVTEIPYSEGVAFPGLIDLSWGTFQYTATDGFDEFFRAHEVAHQWWGIGVMPATYRDAWLAEGLASFSALWFVQSERHHFDEYFKFLDQYRSDIAAAHEVVGPISIGYRSSTPDHPSGYSAMIYEKGAWVFHMLRIMMLNLGSMRDDRFTETMQDFYQTFRGHWATTEDFQRVVEKHAGVPMDWFFDEWVRGTAIPTYHVAWTSQPTADGRYTVKLRVTQEHVPPDFKMSVLVTADLGQNRFAHFRVFVTGDQTEYVSPLLPAPAQAVIFNELHSVMADVKMERW